MGQTLNAQTPQIDASAWVAPSAQVYGNVVVAAEASLWPNVVIRCECRDVRIGRMTNVQDFVMIHIGYEHSTHIGEFCSITHHATVHGATVEDHCLVGVGATLMDGARIGAGSIVAGGAFVTEGAEFEPGSIIAGVPAKVIARRDSARANRMNAWLYHYNAEAYRRGDHRVWVGEEFEQWKAAKQAEVATDLDLRPPVSVTKS